MNDMVTYQGAQISTAQEVVSHALRVQEIMKAVMKPDVHYGVIPGTKKNTLFKPGAEALCVAFRIAPTYDVIEERFDDGVRYRVTCHGVHQGSKMVVADGLGSCSSMEEKYKWCKAYPSEYDEAPPDRRRIVKGKDWTTKQVRVETADIENTLLKMACKRAMIAMVLNALAVSDIFTQDTEDLSQKVRDMVADDDKPGVKGPQSNGEQAARDLMTKHGVGGAATYGGNGGGGGNGATVTNGGGGNGEAKESPPASDGMLNLIRKKIANAELDEIAFCKEHGIDALPGITVAKGNELLVAITNRGASA